MFPLEKLMFCQSQYVVQILFFPEIEDNEEIRPILRVLPKSIDIELG